MDEVTVIGCGPSAMMIGHAAEQLGVRFRFIAPKRKSFISGAQYLHRDVGVQAEGLAPSTVTYVHRGDEFNYERKIYGRRLPDGLVTSWSKFPDKVEAWPLREIYEYLWERYQDLIDDRSIDVREMIALGAQGLVFNTAPLPSFVTGRFKTEKVTIVNGIGYVPFGNSIVYNGLPTHAWYRSSELWGNLSVEFPSSVRLPPWYRQRFKVVEVDKPLATDVAIPNVVASGRYGRWEKGVLVDESYFQALEEIKARC